MKKFFILATMAALTVWSCGKTDDPAPKPDPTPSGKAPVANFTYAADGLTVTFTNSSTDATSYLWNFGDGTTSTETSPVHSYSAADDYKVTLTAANDAGDQSKKEVTISVAGAPKAYFSATSIKERAGKFGKIIELDATSSENAVSIAWDFGDGETLADGTQFTVQHEFPAFDETYKVKATITSAAGEQNTYESDVTVVAYNELLKGGSMEKDDAQYWTWYGADASYPNDEDGIPSYDPNPGVPSFVAEFGYTGDGPKGGKGGCLRLGGENQYHDWAHNITVYQAIELEEGDVIQLSAQLKWGENVNDCGLFWLCIDNKVNDEGKPVADDPNIFVQFFNWWHADGNAVPAYDGDLTGSENYENGVNEELFSSPVDEDGNVYYKAPETGTYYIMFNVRNVWSTECYGPGKDYFIDEVSAKIIL